jgi:hypothetical protein
MAKIGLYNLEPHIVNSAMMRLSTYFKNKNDLVERFQPLFYNSYDKIYVFSIFDFTPKLMVKENMICGGTGFDLETKLPSYIEKCDYDWSLYPNCDYSIIWFSSGCIRRCPFCVVPEKEGEIRPEIPRNLNPNGKYIKIQDNNFFANKGWEENIYLLKLWQQSVDFTGGIDVRILNKKMCLALNSLKHEKQIKIAWDNPKENLVPKLKEIIKIIPSYKLMCYVLIGFWSKKEEDLYRVEKLRELKIDPFVMPYNKLDSYQKRFARWVNHKAIFKSVKWDEYNG